MDWIPIIVRIVHIGSAIAVVGGAAYVLAALAPATRLLDDDLRENLINLARRRSYRVLHPGLVLLIISGAYQWWNQIDIYRTADKSLQALLGVKVLIALGIVGIVFGETFGVLKGSPLRWVKVNLILATAIIILAAIVRQMRIEAMLGG